jgi:hypothetical protein
MSFRYIDTPKGKVLARVHFNRASKTTADRTIYMMDGTTYTRMLDGSMRRVSPVRPYRGKAGRKACLAARRLEKAAN